MLNVLYCLENAFVSCRVHVYVSGLLLRDSPQTPPGLCYYTLLEDEVPIDPLCPPYLQTLASLLPNIHVGCNSRRVYLPNLKKVKERIAVNGFPFHSYGSSLNCHMGSHSVTCYLTQVNAPRLNPSQQAGTRFTYPGMEG